MAARERATSTQRYDQANSGPVNSLIGKPFPTSADVESVRSDGDCTKTGDTAFVCKVSLVRRNTQPESAGTVLHAELAFAKGADGNWQTSDINEALVLGAAKSVVDRVNQALPDHAASNPS
jgi:ketosteroid isomerase-like protein